MPSPITPEDESQSFATYAAIAATLETYIEAARTGQGRLMREAFAEGAHIRGHYAGKPVDWPLAEFCGLIDKNGPAAAVEARIAGIEVEGGAAMARLEARDWRGTRYTDFFVLLKLAEGWRITSKVFFAHSRG